MVVLVAASVVLVVWGLVSARRGRPPARSMLLSGGAIEVLLLVQAAVAGVSMVADRGPEGSSVLFVSYLATVVLVLPAALGWALVERDRWSSAVVAVGALTVATMVIRLWDVWSGGVQIGAPGA